MRGLLEELRAHVGLRDGREAFLVVGTLLLVVVWLYGGSAATFDRLAGPGVSEWWRWVYYHSCALLLLAVVPLLVMWRAFGVRPGALGVCLGDVDWGLRATLLGMLIVTPIVYLSSFDPAFQREYPLTKLAGENLQTWLRWEGVYLIYYVGWEVYFRGVLLFGLRDRFGTAGATAFQTAISTLVHIGKPFGEIAGAAPGGILFGAMALRSGSILWPLLVHWYMGALMDVCAYRHGLGLLP